MWREYSHGNVLYMFLDESGDFDFSPSGSRFLTLTCLTTHDPLSVVGDLHALKHYLIETAPDRREIEFFHAHNDPRPVRLQVLALLAQCSHYRIDSVTFPKNVIHPPLRDAWNFYPHAAALLIPWVLRKVGAARYDRLIVIMDRLRLPRDKEVFLKAIKVSVKKALGPGQSYDVWMHQSRSHPLLQVVDYYGWVVFRQRELNDGSYYAAVQHQISSDFLFYSRVSHRYY